MTKRLNLPEQEKGQMTFFMCILVVVVYIFAFIFDFLDASALIGVRIGGAILSFACFIEVVLGIISFFYILRTGDRIFLVFCLLASLVFAASVQLSFGRLL